MLFLSEKSSKCNVFESERAHMLGRFSLKQIKLHCCCSLGCALFSISSESLDVCMWRCLPLTDRLLIKGSGHTDNGIICATVRCAALIIETLELMFSSKLGIRKRKMPWC